MSVCAGTGWNGWKPPGRNFVAITWPEPVSSRRKRPVKTPWIIAGRSNTMFTLGCVTISCVNGSSRSHSTIQWRSTR